MQVDVPTGLIETQGQLDDALSAPSRQLVEAMAQLDGDVMVLGAGGKMGPTLARMARRAMDLAGIDRQVYGVSRFSGGGLREELEAAGVRTVRCDLMQPAEVASLPDVPYVVYLAGRKFGTAGDEPTTWAMNTYVPAVVAQRFSHSRLVALSTGNVYPLTPVDVGGPTESDPVGPVGEYAQSCLGRERIFQYFSSRFDTPVTLVRLNYAVELRYGVLLDIARKVRAREPIDLAAGYVNVIWQRDANEACLRCLEICDTPPAILNLAGPMVPVRDLAERFGEAFGVEPVFAGRESETALLSDGSKCERLFGPPTVTVEQMVRWVAHWAAAGKQVHDLATHYEQREGRY